MLCFFKTKHYKTGIFFDQVSTIQRYISEVHYAWIMYINCSLKTKDGILVFVKYLKILPKKMSLSVPHHVWMRLREFVILVALELLIWYSVVLFQHQKQQKNLKFNKLELCRYFSVNMHFILSERQHFLILISKKMCKMYNF